MQIVDQSAHCLFLFGERCNCSSMCSIAKSSATAPAVVLRICFRTRIACQCVQHSLIDSFADQRLPPVLIG